MGLSFSGMKEKVTGIFSKKKGEKEAPAAAPAAAPKPAAAPPSHSKKSSAPAAKRKGISAKLNEKPPEAAIISGQKEKVDSAPFTATKNSLSYFAEDAERLATSKTSHTMESEYTNLQLRKKNLDVLYQDKMTSAVSMAGIQNPKDAEAVLAEREAMTSMKQRADTAWQVAEKKGEKNIGAHKNLEKIQRTSPNLAKIIKHADSLQGTETPEAETGTETEAQTTGTEGTEQTTPEAAQTPETDQGTEGGKKGKKEKKPKFRKRALIKKIAKAVHGATNHILGAVSSSYEVFKELGGDAKEGTDTLLSTKEQLKKTGGFEWAGSLMGIINLAVGGVKIGKSIVDSKKSKTQQSSKQETWHKVREMMGLIQGAISSVISIVSPFTALVPFLGTTLSIVDNGLGLIVDIIETATVGAYMVQSAKEKDRLWDEIERKRDKYARDETGGSKEDSLLYEIDFDDTHASTDKQLEVKNKDKTSHNKKSWLGSSTDKRVDEKRRRMMQVVSQENNIAMGPGAVGENAKATNVSQFIGAETNISTRIADMRKQKRTGAFAGTDRDYKRKMHQMEALQMMSQYRVMEKAEKKMSKSFLHGMESVGKDCGRIIADGLKLVGEITAATGYGAAFAAAGVGLNAAISVYEMSRAGGSRLYKWGRMLSGAEANKKNTRKEMANYLFDKMVSIGPSHVPWSADAMLMDNTVEDYTIREESKSMGDLDKTLSTGLDTVADDFLSATNATEMKGALATAFSQG